MSTVSKTAKLLRIKQAKEALSGIYYEEHASGSHLVVYGNNSVFDFWPTTARYIQRNGSQSGKGLYNLIDIIIEDV